MTDVLALRKATAEKIGWTEIETCTDRDGEKYLLGLRVCAVYKEFVPHYEASMDACLRDVVPWAREHGDNCGYYVEIVIQPDKSWAQFIDIETDESGPVGESENCAAEALCLAVLELEG